MLDKPEQHRPRDGVPYEPEADRRPRFGLPVLRRHLDGALGLGEAEPTLPHAFEVARPAHVASVVARVMDEGNGRVRFVAKLPDEVDHGRHLLLTTLVPRRCL